MVSNLPFLKNKLITMAKPTGGSVKSHTAKQHKKRPDVLLHQAKLGEFHDNGMGLTLINVSVYAISIL